MWISDAAGHWRIKEMGIGIFSNSLGFEHWWDEMMGISTSKRWRYLISQNEEIKITGDVTNEIADLTVKSQCIVSLVARFIADILGLSTTRFVLWRTFVVSTPWRQNVRCDSGLWPQQFLRHGELASIIAVLQRGLLYIYIHIQKLVKHNDTWNFPHEYNILYI